MAWPIERKVQWGLGIAVVVLSGLGLMAYALIVNFMNTSEWLLHTHKVIETIQGTRTGLDDAETSVRGYMLTQKEPFLDSYDLVKGRIPGVIQRLQILTSDNAVQSKKVDQLKVQVEQEMEVLRQVVEAVKRGGKGSEEAFRLLDEDQRLMNGIRNRLREIRLAEEQLLLARDGEWRRNLTATISAAAILGLLNFLLLASIYFVFKRDLTERRRAEGALAASEERLRQLISSARDYAFFMLDPTGRVTTWNEGAAIIKGYEASEILGKQFSTFFGEEDRKAGRPEAVLKEAAASGRAEIEGWRVRKDGSKFWTDAITSAIHDDHGRLVGFSEVARDITEQKKAAEALHESESRLAAILDGSPSIIFVKDPEGRYTLVNRRFEDAFQMKRDDIVGKTDQDLFRGDTGHKLSGHDATALAAGKAVEFEESIPQKGKVHTYLTARVPLVNEDGKPYALCGVLTDITERKESEQEIQRLNRALQDRVVDRSVQLMQSADELKIERGQRLGAEEREREARNSLREVMQSSPVPMWTYDSESLALLEMNNAALSLHDASRQEFSRLKMVDLYPREEISELGRRAGRSEEVLENPTICHLQTREGREVAIGLIARHMEWDDREVVLVLVVSEAESTRLRDISNALEAASS